MLQKLRIKLILINMLSLSLVLLILFSTVYLVIYNILVKQEDTLLRKVAITENYNIIIPEHEDEEELVKDENFYKNNHVSNDGETQMLSLFYVKKDKRGDIFHISPNIFADIGSINHLVDKVDRTYLKKGKIDIAEVQLAYLVETKEYGSIYIFTDRSARENFVKSFLWVSVSGFIVTIVVVFFMSMAISKNAIQPIKDAMEDQDKFITDASHELRTPLSVIQSNIELVLDSPDMKVGENTKWLKFIHEEAKRMTRMTENFLLLSKTSAGNSKYTPLKKVAKKQRKQVAVENADYEEFSLSELIDNICYNFKPLVNSHGLEFKKEIQSDVNFYASKERISQLMTIFIDNAMKYTKAGEITVSLQEQENIVKIKIKDSGMGIKKEDQQKIFERFYRVEKSRSRALGGAGLGLSIAQNIVNEYGGHVEVESEVDAGTEFTITLNVIV